jgi:hypothetical protein
MAEAWEEHSNAQRGAFIRSFWNKPNTITKSLVSKNFISATADPKGSLGVDYSTYPTEKPMDRFKAKVFTSFREYLDGVGFNFAANISNEQIGILAGPNPDLTDINAQEFVRRAGIIGGGAGFNPSRETGVEQEEFTRGMTQSAILTPDDYIKQANNDLKRIDDQSLIVFNASLDKYYNEYKYPFEEAKKKALEDQKVYRSLLMKGHREMFKAELFNKADKKLGTITKREI